MGNCYIPDCSLYSSSQWKGKKFSVEVADLKTWTQLGNQSMSSQSSTWSTYALAKQGLKKLKNIVSQWCRPDKTIHAAFQGRRHLYFMYCRLVALTAQRIYYYILNLLLRSRCMNTGPYWGETKWLLQSSHGKSILQRAKCVLKRASVEEKEDEVQLLTRMHRAICFFFPPCFRKQWSSYARCRRTSVKCGGCRCSATYPCFVWLEKATRKCSIFGVQRPPWAGIPFINILFLPSDREFSKPGKHCLFYNLVPTSLYTRQFVWFS